MPDDKVLIVEDDQTLAFGIQGLIEREGYRVVGVAGSGEQAISMALENQPDVILMDIRLRGDMDGVQAARSIQHQLDIPIIYLTGESEAGALQRSKATGPFAYIFKPFDGRHLYTTIDMTLYRHKVERKIQENERWLNAVLNNIGEGVMAADHRALITFLNPVAEMLSGWRQAEAIGRPLTEVMQLIDETTGALFTPFGMQVPEQGVAFCRRNRLILKKKNGSEVPIEITLAPIAASPGKAEGVVVAFRDITERRQAEREIRRQASLSQALARVASRLNAQLDLQIVLDTIAKETATTLNVPVAGVMLYDDETDSLDMAATHSQSEEFDRFCKQYHSILREGIQYFIQAKESVFIIPDVQHLASENNAEPFAKADFRSMATAVMSRGEQIVGTLHAVTVGERRQFSSNELAFLKGLADQAMIAILNARLFEQVLSGRERMKYISKKLVEVQEEERRFLARELHDQIGQVLTGLQFSLEGGKQLSGEDLKNNLEEAQELVSHLMGQLRELSLNLRPPMLDDLGLLPTLLWHFDQYCTQTGVHVNFWQLGLDRRLSPEIETAAFRIIQEALTNTARYADVREVKVECISTDGLLKVTIRDEGKGFDPAKAFAERRTFGLAGMHERANLLGGKFEVDSAPNQGTQVCATFPVSRALERRRFERNRAVG